MKLTDPIDTVHLFPKLDEVLIELLPVLTTTDWVRPTITPGWTIKEVAAHVLDDTFRSLLMLSMRII